MSATSKMILADAERVQREFLGEMSKPTEPGQRHMVCCDCSAYIVATVEQAKALGWKLWLGGCRCKACGVKVAERAGEPPQVDPGPMSPKDIAKHRKTLTPKYIGEALDMAERATCCYGMIGLRAEGAEVGRMAERPWTMVKEGRR